MSGKLSVLLAFPPVWLPEAPFLSTPILSAYLKERGVAAVQRDLNVEFWLHCETDQEVRDVYRRCQRHWQALSARVAWLQREEEEMLAVLAPFIKLSEQRFVDEVRHGVIARAAYRRLIQAVGKFRVDAERAWRLWPLAEQVQRYHDLLYSDISHSAYASSTADLSAILADDANPFRAYFQDTLGGDRELRECNVFGLSIAAINQVVPAFTLASQVKQWAPRTHVVIGGSWCTQVHLKLAPRLARFPFIDSMAIYEGEEPLYQLCRALESSGELDEIPNLYVSSHGEVHAPAKRFTMDLNRLPAPDFAGLPLSAYDFPRTLTLQASRGCYWARCTFCSYPLLEPAYKSRRSEKLIGEIQHLKNAYGVEDVGFTDALLSPSFCRRFSAALLAAGVQIRWAMFARFEKQFTPELLAQMAARGCSVVSWGLESVNQDILALIEKSISLAHAETILAAGAACGIHNRVLVMYGHPTETFSQVMDTVGFLRRNLAGIHSLAYNYYHPEMGTPVESLAAKLGVQLEPERDRDLGFGYRWDSQLTADEKCRTRRMFEELSQRLAADRVAQTAAAGRREEPAALFQADGSFSVTVPGAAGDTTVLSAVVDRGHGKRREVFLVSEV